MKTNVKEALLAMGYPSEDVKTISETRIRITNSNGKSVSQAKAIEILGLTQFASGLGRATFHFSCGRGDRNYLSFENKTWRDFMEGKTK